jgi:CHAT domain-containing protein/tetratricopeptide (TPR) repeat protein
VTSLTADASTEDLLELVGRDPSAALAFANEVVSRHRRPSTTAEALPVVIAQRAAGLALRQLGDPAAGAKRVRAGVALAERVGDVLAAGEARTTLAFLLVELGQTRAALTATDHALSVLRGVPAARARATRALVLHRASRFREARYEYDAALSVFRRAKDRDWEARVLHNRGLVSLELGDTHEALADLRASREYSLSMGETVDAADALFNMGVALECAGDVPAALELFDQADTEWGDLERPQRWLGRVDAYLNVGLVAEAIANARAAIEWLAEREWKAQSAHAKLSLATSLLSLSPPDLEGATAAAEGARVLFRAQDRREAEAVAEYVLFKALLLGSRASWDVSRIRDVAGRLSDAGNDSAASDLRSSAGVSALKAGDVDRARVVLGPLTALERARPLDVRTRAWFARALLAECDGDLPEAVSALRRSWQCVEAQRSFLGATELRASASTHATAVVETGVRLARAEGSAPRVFEWAERGRSSALRTSPALPPDDPDLARALARLRTASRTEDEARLDGEADRSARAARVRSEADVLRITRRTGGPTARASRPVSAHAVRASIGTDTFIHYVADGDTLLAVVVRREGIRLVDLGQLAQTRAACETATFALRRILTGFGTSSGQRAASAALGSALQMLDDALVRPLAEHLRGSVVVCPCSDLTTVPWPALPSLKGRSPRIAPSATTWLAAQERPSAVDPRALLVAGPDLPGAYAETELIARLHVNSETLIGESARVGPVLDKLERSDIVHIAAHGVLRRDNPLFSAVELADGPLTGYDLESMAHVPSCVVLSACSSGAGHATVADETLGLAWILLGRGARHVVAPLLPVPDASTTPLMVALHAALRDGCGAPEALSAAAAGVSPDDVRGVAVASVFVAYGA